MDSDFVVFAVEDEAMMADLLGGILAGQCELECHPSAEATLARLAVRKPDMLLVDIGLPGMDGYALCRLLKDDPDTADLPVVFLSGHDSIEARLAGYEAGGEDFIVKPFEPEELRRKIAVAHRIRDEKRSLRAQADDARRTAFSAMSSMGELGVVLEFMRKSFASDDAASLARCLLEALEQYGLEGAVQVRLGGRELSLSAEGTDLPLESAILCYVSHLGRVAEFHQRGIYNFGGITLLVKNVPLDDPERRGRLRDNLAILAEGADARRQAIEVEHSNDRSQQAIGEVLVDLRVALAGLHHSHQQQKQRTARLMATMQEALIQAFINMGLSELQENTLTDLIEQYFGELCAELEAGDGLPAQLQTMADQLRRACTQAAEPRA